MQAPLRRFGRNATTFPFLLGAALALIVWASIVIAIYVRPAVGAEACHQIFPGDAIPAGYGAPYSVLAQSPTLLVQVVCDGTKATVTAGSGNELEYIYRQGYDWRGVWQPISLSGPQRTGDWYIGQASASVSRSAADMAKDNFVVAYVCTWTGSEWKCGCRTSACTTNYWQLQVFKYQVSAGGGMFKGHDGELMVAYPSTNFATAGTQIELTGDGFTAAGNTVHFGSHRIKNRPSSSGSSLTFTIPSVPVGRYEVTVQNSNGTADPGTVIWVTSPGATPPTITSISPSSGGPNTEVVIKGTGFTSTGNEVMAGHSSVQNVSSSDGKTLRFTMKGFPGVTKWQNENGVVQHPGFPITVRVANTNGVAIQGAIFNLQY